MSEPQYYIERASSQVLGPLTARGVQARIILGRIGGNDLSSTDGQTWERVADLPWLVPEGLVKFDRIVRGSVV